MALNGMVFGISDLCYSDLIISSLKNVIFTLFFVVDLNRDRALSTDADNKISNVNFRYHFSDLFNGDEYDPIWSEYMIWPYYNLLLLSVFLLHYHIYYVFL